MECISLCSIPCLCTLSASAFIDSSQHQLDFFLEIFLWRLWDCIGCEINNCDTCWDTYHLCLNDVHAPKTCACTVCVHVHACVRIYVIGKMNRKYYTCMCINYVVDKNKLQKVYTLLSYRHACMKPWMLVNYNRTKFIVLYWWRLKRGTEQVAERRNEGTEQLQIVEEPVMNGTRVWPQ